MTAVIQIMPIWLSDDKGERDIGRVLEKGGGKKGRNRR